MWFGKNRRVQLFCPTVTYSVCSCASGFAASSICELVSNSRFCGLRASRFAVDSCTAVKTVSKPYTSSVASDASLITQAAQAYA